MTTARRALGAALLLGLLVPALLLTGLRLVQPGAGWAVRAVSFAPFSIPLYAAAAVALVGLLVRAARERDGARALAGRGGAVVVVLVLLLLHISWVMPAFTGEPPAPAVGTPRLRVMTLNVLAGGATPDDVVGAVREADADVVVLQEVTQGFWSSSAGLRRSHPYVAGLAPDGRPDTVVLARRPLGREVSVETVGDSLHVTVRLGARQVDLLAVHPRYPERPTAWRHDHAVLAAEVRRTRPALVMGDFNATYDHAVMRRYRQLGYRSAAELLNTGWSPTWPSNGARRLWGIPLPRVVQIDHVMVARHLTALTVEHVKVPGTDHQAVVAEVTLRG